MSSEKLEVLFLLFRWPLDINSESTSGVSSYGDSHQWINRATLVVNASCMDGHQQGCSLSCLLVPSVSRTIQGCRTGASGVIRVKLKSCSLIDALSPPILENISGTSEFGKKLISYFKYTSFRIGNTNHICWHHFHALTSQIWSKFSTPPSLWFTVLLVLIRRGHV